MSELAKAFKEQQPFMYVFTTFKIATHGKLVDYPAHQRVPINSISPKFSRNNYSQIKMKVENSVISITLIMVSIELEFMVALKILIFSVEGKIHILENRL